MRAETEMLQDYLERLSKEEPEVIFCHRMNETDRLWNFDQHSHDCLEAICFLQGELMIRQGTQKMEAAASSVILHPPGTVHQEFPLPGRHREVIALWIKGKKGPAPDRSFQILDREGAIRWLFQQIYQEYGRKTPDSAQLIGCYLPALCLQLGRAWRESGQGDILERITGYLQENLSRPVTLQELARIASVSPSYVERIFRKKAGVTPMGYLRTLRMQEACRLLAQSGLSVEEIGRRVGIFDPSYFWRSFRRETGYSPSAYRRRMSAKEK